MYDADEIPHEQATLQFLKEICDYREIYSPPPPVNPRLVSKSHYSPEEVQAMDPENARFALNQMVSQILSEQNSGSVEKYENFLKEYAVALQVASYINEMDPKGQCVFGYEICEKVGGGAFGSVYRASDKSDAASFIALKTLRPEVRQDKVMLESFRRGVNSMKILARNKVRGMVEYKEAYEIPPIAIMDFIEGENLESIAKRRDFSPILDGVPIIYFVFAIVRQAHNLPETVYHRDLRPSNIMITDFSHSNVDSEKVNVLDFDLSWHIGANDFKISPNMTTVLGYLAPEQINKISGVDARDAAVDVYGLAMTLFFIISGRHPESSEAYAEYWESTVRKCAFSHIKESKWKCLPNIISRLIVNATKKSQSERVSAIRFFKVLEQLFLLVKSESSFDEGVSDWVYIDEIASRICGEDKYEFNDVKSEAAISSINGFTLHFSFSNAIGPKNLTFIVESQFRGTQNFGTVSKYWPKKLEKIESIAKSLKCCELENQSVRNQIIRVSGEIPRHMLNSNFNGISQGFSQIKSILSNV